MIGGGPSRRVADADLDIGCRLDDALHCAQHCILGDAPLERTVEAGRQPEAQARPVPAEPLRGRRKSRKLRHRTPHVGGVVALGYEIIHATSRTPASSARSAPWRSYSAITRSDFGRRALMMSAYRPSARSPSGSRTSRPLSFETALRQPLDQGDLGAVVMNGLMMERSRGATSRIRHFAFELRHGHYPGSR